MTLNINGIASDTKFRMLEELLRRQEIDIVLLQEVVNHTLKTISGYHTHTNVGTGKRGTALVMKEGIHVKEIKRLPTGRGIAAKIENTCIINIYAPSGTGRKAEMEQFYNTGITHIFPATHTEMILAGDFNCTLAQTDCTGTPNNSAALNKLIKGLGLTDAWNPQTRESYTHYTATGASRIDRIYTTIALLSRKTGIETMAVAFTDHNAVILRIALNLPIQHRGRGYWKINSRLLQEKTYKNTLKTRWETWTKNKKHFPTSVMWWSRYVKRRIKITFIAEGVERRQDRQQLKNFYYKVMNNIIRDNSVGPATTTKLKEIKARIIRIHREEQQKKRLDKGIADGMPTENPSLYHILRTQKRQEMRNIVSITDNQGITHTDTRHILETFTNHLKGKYGTLPLQARHVQRMGKQIPTWLSNETNTELEAQVTKEEMKTAIRKGEKRKAPGSDGICDEFYTAHWDIIREKMLDVIQQLHTKGNIMPQQKHGIIVLLPKTTNPSTPDHYRALTLLNADIKIMARIIANRLNRWLPDIIHSSQQCGIQGTSILDATATVRDVIAYAEHTKKKLCLLSLDFKAAFDRISNTYLYKNLRDHGFSEKCFKQIQTLYEDATVSVQINGHVSGPIPILSSIRQGCP
jgi:exonuclease III